MPFPFQFAPSKSVDRNGHLLAANILRIFLNRKVIPYTKRLNDDLDDLLIW